MHRGIFLLAIGLIAIGRLLAAQTSRSGAADADLSSGPAKQVENTPATMAEPPQDGPRAQPRR